ncbi:MAG: Gfo/Idh/MocA family oxidoreductase [Ferruginibacter sp.]|nr:Gfo/Idh/MocA family oxidoreductase [Ferruginibacter sp.]
MQKNFAIIGCGRISNRHAEQISKVGNVKAVCDIIPGSANILAQQFDATPYYSIDALLSAEHEIDVVSICTPNGLHATHAIKALKAGMHVLCEKPLCINVADGEAMIAAALENEKNLFVVKQNRYNPPVIYLKDLIEKKLLGKIFSFQVNCFWNRPTAYYQDWKGKKEMDGGTLFTQFSHFIDLVYWLLGDVKLVQKNTANFAHPTIEFEDTGTVLLTMQSGAIGSINYTVNSYQKNMEGSITVFGQHGTVKIGGQYLNELEYFEVKDLAVPQLPKGNIANAYGFYQGSMSNHDKVYENLVQVLEDPTHQFASAADGLKTVEIIERIYRGN